MVAGGLRDDCPPMPSRMCLASVMFPADATPGPIPAREPLQTRVFVNHCSALSIRQQPGEIRLEGRDGGPTPTRHGAVLIRLPNCDVAERGFVLCFVGFFWFFFFVL